MKKTFFTKFISLWIAVNFATSTILPSSVFAQSVLNLPQPGTMIGLTQPYMPVLIKGLKVHPDNPLLFDFILDTGHSGLKTDSPAFKAESDKLIKYFLTAMTIKEDDLWVNLSPYEKDRMIPEALGKTRLGADMLGQDYILKQLTASLMYPEKELGKKFWDKVYAKAKELYGVTEIPVDTFNKVWIVADKAKVLEKDNTAYVVGARLRVMLEEDYLAMNAATVGTGLKPVPTDNAAEIIREIIVPEIEKEVNEGQNFAPLRQMFYSMILATWYKITLKEALLNQVYSNKAKTGGVETDDPAVKEKIYNQYLEAYTKGVFNYIKEDEDPQSGEIIPRKYFSGGEKLGLRVGDNLEVVSSAVTLADLPAKGGDLAMVTVGVDKANAPMLGQSASPVSLKTKIALGTGATALTVGIFVGGYYYKVHKGVNDWLNSKSKLDIVAIENASKKSDVKSLDKIGEKAWARHSRIQKLIWLADESGVSVIGNVTKDPIELARKYGVFDLFTATFANLEENKYSQEPESRVGLVLPQDWQDRIALLESEAKRSGFEGDLAVTLRKLKQELSQQETSIKEMQKSIEDFSSVAPAFFKGEMKGDIDVVKESLVSFQSTEQSPEKNLYEESYKNMIQRVSDKLYQQNDEFKSHRDRRDNLSKLLEGQVRLYLKVAKKIIKDADDGDFEALTGMMGVPGMYSMAIVDGVSAYVGIKELRNLLLKLRKDEIFKAEQLDLQFPNISGNIGAVKKKLDRLEQEVLLRLNKEETLIKNEISKDLAQQISKASENEGSSPLSSDMDFASALKAVDTALVQIWNGEEKDRGASLDKLINELKVFIAKNPDQEQLNKFVGDVLNYAIGAYSDFENPGNKPRADFISKFIKSFHSGFTWIGINGKDVYVDIWMDAVLKEGVMWLRAPQSNIARVIIDRIKLAYKRDQSKVSSGIEAIDSMKMDTTSPVGGIDLDRKNLNMNIAKEGQGVEVKFDKIMVDEFMRGDFSGVVPVILQIVPIPNLLPVFGMESTPSNQLKS